MYQALNGWTKKQIILAIKTGNKGTVSLKYQDFQSQAQGCAYRGFDGNKCIVGCFIPDSLYDPSMEGTTIEQLSILHDCMPLPIKALEELQYMHDITSWQDDPRPEAIQRVQNNLKDIS
jgi:hypothetical protein